MIFAAAARKADHARSASIPYWLLYLTEGVVEPVLPLPIFGGKVPIRSDESGFQCRDAKIADI